MIDFSFGKYSCTYERRLRQLGLLLLIGFFCTFFSARVAEASPAVIEVNSSGSLLAQPTGGSAIPSSRGALTMNSFDVYAPAITIPTTWEGASLTVPGTTAERQTWAFAFFDHERLTQHFVALDETVAFGEVPKLSIWAAAMLAAGGLLFSALSRCGWRRLAIAEYVTAAMQSASRLLQKTT